jgi:hypothetical protein
MKIQPMRKKTPVSVHTSWPMHSITAKKSSPFNLVSKFTADKDQSERNLSKPKRLHFISVHVIEILKCLQAKNSIEYIFKFK